MKSNMEGCYTIFTFVLELYKINIKIESGKS